MEIMVSMFIFMLASVVIADIFVNVQRAQARLRSSQTASTNARYLMDVLTRELRADAIDYCLYAGLASGCDTSTIQTVVPSTTSNLYLLTSSHQSVVFELVPSTPTTGGYVQISRGGAPFSTITAPTLSVDQLNFYITPLSDPFSANGAVCGTPPACSPDTQPQVTIVLKLSTLDTKVDNRVSSYLQTTVTSRAYVR